MTDTGANRPSIAVAMLAGLDHAAFGPHHWDRLHQIGNVLDRAPLTDLDDHRSRAVLAEAEVLLGHWGCPTLTADVLARAPRLRLFAYGAGTVKWQVTDALWDRGIVVTSAAAANAVPVAEYTVAMILLANKGALLFRERLRAPDVAVPLVPARVGNVAKTVGIVGASFVGRAVIALLEPFDLHVALYDPFVDAPTAAALGVELVGDLNELCARSDVLSIHAPDVEATRGMIGATQLAHLRDGATVINTARPALIDQDALVAELQRGRIAAILDVTTPEPLPRDSPLLGMANAFVTPHIAGSMGTELGRMADLAIDEIERFARGEPQRYEVRRTDLHRIA